MYWVAIKKHASVYIYVWRRVSKCQLLLSEFNKNYSGPTNFSKLKNIIFNKIKHFHNYDNHKYTFKATNFQLQSLGCILIALWIKTDAKQRNIGGHTNYNRAPTRLTEKEIETENTVLKWQDGSNAFLRSGGNHLQDQHNVTTPKITIDNFIALNPSYLRLYKIILYRTIRMPELECKALCFRIYKTIVL